MKIQQSGVFARTVKKLHSNEKKELDEVVKKIAANPEIGTMKVGDLGGVRVYRFRVGARQYLLGYRHDQDASILILLALGSHENFYRDLKR